MIIGFHGRLGSGKDTAAARMAQIVAMPCERVAFADKMKESITSLLGVDLELFNLWKNDPDMIITVEHRRKAPSHHFVELTVREFIQRFGTEAHRDVFGTDFWVDQTLRHYRDEVYGRKVLMLVTDVRMPNELSGVQDRGGVVVEIKGANEPEITETTHATELPLEGSDYTIDNTVLDDEFWHLDNQLYDLAIKLGLPLKKA